LVESMNSNLLLNRRLRAASMMPRRRARLQRMRVTLDDGARTTVHLASYELAAYRPRVVALERPTQLVRWCRQEGTRHAIVGGFYARPDHIPLGQLQLDGAPQRFIPFEAPWGEIRACLQIEAGAVRIARRDSLGAAPAGDLLQAGPLLVAGGAAIVSADEDREGFSAAAHQFDSDITSGRYPRAALGLAGDRLLAVACDGRTEADAGLTLSELAAVLVRLGATDALNLDGGGSASLVHDGRLRNRPREQHGADLLDGRAVATAIVFEPR
jgi:hypothetical protein